MEIKIPKTKLDAFDLIVKNIRSAVKNSVLYAPGHPVFDSAVKNFKISLDKWFSSEDSLNLGISYNNLLLDGNYVREKDEFYAEAANFFYTRGLIAISFVKGVEPGELIEFFKIIKGDIKVVREEGGIAEKLSSLRNIKVKEINYGFILSDGKKGSAEKDIWQTLLETVKESRESRLPESKFEFLSDFLKNPKKSALLLNKIYRDTRENVEGEGVTDDILRSVAGMYKYFKEDSDEDMEFKKGILYVVMHLDLELAVKLFEKKAVDGKNFDLAQEILKDFPDEFVSDFIISLIGEEGSVNENLLKIFDKLTYDKNRSEAIAPVVAGTLLQKYALDKEALSKLQLSVGELFKNHPGSNFMSQMYKMTVHTVVDAEINEFVIPEKLASLAKEYIESIKEESLRKNRLELLLNIIWFEDNVYEFKKFTAKTMDIFRELLALKDIGSVKKILELFAQRLRPEQIRDNGIASAVKEAIEEMTGKKAAAEIIAMIPQLDDTQLNDAAYALLKAGNNCAALLMDAFASRKDLPSREKIVYLLSVIEKDIQENIMTELGHFDFSAVKDFLKILNKVDAVKARLLAKKLIYHKEKQVRLESLRIFEIETEEDKNGIFEILSGEKDEEIIKEVMAILLRTKNKEFVNRLFKLVENNSRNRKYLSALVELCGYLRAEDARRHLKRILFHRSIFDTKKRVKLRMASAVSLMQLGNDEAVEWIKKGTADKRKSISRICNIMMQLGQNSVNEKTADSALYETKRANFPRRDV